MSPFPATSLLDKLRGSGSPRPRIDPELAGGLKEWLEDSFVDQMARLELRGRALRVNSRALEGSANSEFASTSLGHRGGPTDGLSLSAVVRCLFRQWVTTGQIGDPMGDAIAGLAASGDPVGAIDFVSRMNEEEISQFTEVVGAHAARIVATWPTLSPAWYPRTRERMTIPLCGGRLVLAGIADLVVGSQATSEASVCIVEVETEQRRSEHRSRLHFLALLETLRAGAAPSRVATYYTATGELDVEPVNERLLVRALRRTVAGAERLCSQQPYGVEDRDRCAVAHIGAPR